MLVRDRQFEREEPTLRIGELARRTGLTVRALRFYDEVGLLRPAERTRAGHRLYGKPELLRLQQILALRELGLSLEEIAATLRGPQSAPRRVIELQLGRLREKLALLNRLCRRLEALAARIDRAEEVSADDLIATIEEMTMFEKYYSQAQLAELKQRAESVGEERIKQVEGEWKELIAKVGAEMQRGTPASDPRVFELAAKWMALVKEFTGGNPEIAKSLGRMMKEEPAARDRAGVDPAMFAYVQAAFASRKPA
jgi:DNA-binding transcriptional MerR regulator